MKNWFRPARRRSAKKNVTRTLLQSAVFWGIFLWLIPVAIHNFESALNLTALQFNRQAVAGWILFAIGDRLQSRRCGDLACVGAAAGRGGFAGSIRRGLPSLSGFDQSMDPEVRLPGAPIICAHRRRFSPRWADDFGPPPTRQTRLKLPDSCPPPRSPGL